MRIICIRPEPGFAATQRNAAAMGLQIGGEPLFRILPVQWTVPDGDYDGVLLGSANAVRLGGAALQQLTGQDAYCVGETTGLEAAKAGFNIAAIGSGGLQTVLDSLSGQNMRLLRLSGADHVPLEPPPGIKVVERVCYASQAMPMSADLVRQLGRPAVILLHSAVAASHFAHQCEANAIDRSGLRLAALGPRIAAAAGGGWAMVECSAKPQDAALLALAKDMCQG
ncbi:uroporphyrinogen-III synthase [Altererythrobacter sp. SALINAS58]|uniref:uroporphyrinogen-III synthase n=1 Tax=Alteripontixanthobacter muriae TaxID=2705546 RepID=UPI001574F3E4|nr:uroporphyrinogen-III synthase [Alteripontixanthobacter muriae]NTZ42851.1 uroporphyrinogen-III synthase [Alteripontixanthobacter muriae]